MDCQIEESCPYSAVKIYINPSKISWQFPARIVSDVEDIGVLTEKLRTGPYGKCVYECNNDVCDNQVCLLTNFLPICNKLQNNLY